VVDSSEDAVTDAVNLMLEKVGGMDMVILVSSELSVLCISDGEPFYPKEYLISMRREDGSMTNYRPATKEEKACSEKLEK